MDPLLKAQEEEITEFYVYRALAERSEGKNREVLKKIAEEELKHYNAFKEITGTDVKPNKAKIRLFVLLSRILGIVFAIKLMERGERKTQESYEAMRDRFPSLESIIEDEVKHERMLHSLVKDELSSYIGSIILGLNDALVEMTGALTGLTFALSASNLIAISSLIVGISAALSMAASEFLSRRAEGSKDPLKAALYTGLAYIAVVLFLVLPFFLIRKPRIALMLSLSVSIALIALFSMYVAVVKDRDIKKEFLTMAGTSLGVAFVSFLVGSLINNVI